MIKAALNSLSFFNLLPKRKQINLALLSLFCLLVLASCSSQKKTPQQQINPNIDEITVEDDTLTAHQHIELAKSLSAEDATNELILASKLFFIEADYLNALWVADNTIPLVDDLTSAHFIQEHIQLTIIKAQSLQELGDVEGSAATLKQLADISNEHNLPLSSSYYRMMANVHQADKQAVAALNAKLHAFSLTEVSKQNTTQVEDIWSKIVCLSQWQLELLAQQNSPGVNGWVAFSKLANKFGANKKQLNYQLTMWRHKYPNHPANIIAEQIIAEVLPSDTIENIAVILPLTGKQKTVGLTIQQGVLASFNNNANTQIHFIDSNTVNWYGINTELSLLEADYVIGPILKSNVDKYISHTSHLSQTQSQQLLDHSNIFIQQDSESLNASNQPYTFPSLDAIDSDDAIKSYLAPAVNPNAVPTLLLNTPNKSKIQVHHTVLSMRPEEEASQAAATLSQKDYQNPIVLSQKNVVSKRIAQAFAKQWLDSTGNELEIVYYDSGNQMQANIKASLAVDKSKQRINQLRRRLNQSIKTQTRNRQDIDMIYLVGTPEQTRLVKPYIEVNISPFAKSIPVYASSRSHGTKTSYNSNTDLRGLTFTEIPWLLPNNKFAELHQLSKSLWPNRNDNLERLFAMGYDSYQLVNKIPLMQQAPYIQHWGQTGVLKLDKDNILTRSLLWGKYHRNNVSQISM